MVGNEEEHEHEYVAGGRTYQGPVGWRRTSWGAIFAGALVTLAVFLTLQILGAGIGASALDLTGSRVTSPTSFGIGAAIWWFITGLIALFIGGWVAGRLSWRLDKLERALHGLTVWSLFYVAMFLLTLTTLGALVGGGVSLLSSGVSAAGQAATTPQGQQAMQQGMQSQGLSPQIIQQELAKILGGGAQQGDPSVAAAVNDYLKSSRTPQDRQRAAQTITQATGMSEAQVNQMLTSLERAAQETRQTTEEAANITGGTLIGMSVAMLIGAIVAALGSLAAPAPPLVPARERETVATTGGRTYTR